MAEFTYQTRKKLTDSWVEDAQTRGAHLSSQEKNMLPSVYHYSIPQDVCKEMRELLEKGTFRSLSEMYRKRFPALVDVCVKKEWQEEFYYALDQMNCYQMVPQKYPLRQLYPLCGSEYSAAARVFPAQLLPCHPCRSSHRKRIPGNL